MTSLDELPAPSASPERRDRAAGRAIARCQSCEIPIAGRGEHLGGGSFCCSGCAAGGPCTCSYDVVAESRHDGATWPIDERAMRNLLARIQRLACDPALDNEHDRRRRLEGLRAQASSASVTFDPHMAAVGRRITIADEDERVESFWLGLPGDEQTAADTISIAAPAGLALAGACVGDVVFLEADERRRWAVVMKVT